MSLDAHLAELVETAVARALSAWQPATAPTAPLRPGSPRLLTVDGAAEFLSISPASVRRLIDSGNLPAVRAFSSIRLDIRDLEIWIESAKGAK